MVITGYAQRIVGDIMPRQIIDRETAASGDPALIAAACLHSIAPDLAEQVNEHDLLVIDGTLSDGPGIDEAIIALQALGLAAVICHQAGPAWITTAGAYGLPLIAGREAAATIAAGNLLRIDLERGSLEARETATHWSIAPLDSTTLKAVQRAQLLARMRQVVEEEGFAE